MPRIKAELMTMPIKFYLRQIVTKAGREPIALPSERTLCTRFNVARGTVRDAIQQLETAAVLIRIPGRKGLFTNPELSSQYLWMIGLISHSNEGYPSEFPSQTALLMSAFLQTMPRRSFYCNIFFPDRFPEEELIRFFQNQNLDALLWLDPDPFYANLISKLRNAGSTIFTANTSDRIKFSLPGSQFDLFPEFSDLDYVLQVVQKLSPQKALFCFHKDSHTHCEWGSEVIKKGELNGIQKVILNLDSDETDVLSDILKHDPEITVLYADGNWYIRQPHVIDALRKSGRNDITLVLENNYFSLALQKEHPDLKIIILEEEPIIKIYRKTGENTAKAIIQYIENKRQEKQE